MTKPRLPHLITGGTGLLGLHWAVGCRADHPVSITVHSRTACPFGVQAIEADLADPRSLDVAIVRSGAKVVVHAAGLTSVERCEADPDAAHHHNTVLAERVAQAAARHGLHLIHVSTDHLFDGREELYDEDSPVRPLNVYGRSKAEAEEAVLKACPSALVLRTNFFGWGPSYRPSFSDWIVGGLREGRSLPLFTDVRYTPTLIAPLIEAALALIERGASGIFHAVGDEALSKHAFGLSVARVFGLDPAPIQAVQLADKRGLVQRPASMALSSAKLQRYLGHGLGAVEEHLVRLRAEEDAPEIKEIRAL